MREKQLYDVIVPMTKDNLPVFQMNIQYIRKNLDCKRVIVIGAEGLREDSLRLGAEFLNEDVVCEGLTLVVFYAYMKERNVKYSRCCCFLLQFL